MTENSLRIFSLSVSVCGIIIAVAFAIHWNHGQMPPCCSSFLVQLLGPYIIVGFASGISRGRVVGYAISCVSLSIFALGAYTCIDLYLNPGINDVTLQTLPFQKLLAIIAAGVSIVSFIARRFRSPAITTRS